MLFLQPLFFSIVPLFVFIVFVLKWVLPSEARKKNVPPSPRKLPIIGNFHQLGLRPHRALRSLSQQHGPLMLLHFGSVPVLVVTSADAAREIMKTYDSIFCSRPKATLPDKLLFGSKDMAFSPYGEYWRQIRSIGVVHLLNSKKVESFRNVREEETALVMEEIRKGSYNSSVLNLSEMFMSLTNDVVCRVALGRKYSGRGDGKRFMELLGDFVEILGVFSIGDYIPWLAWVDRISGLRGRAEKIAHGLDQFLEGVVREHIHKGDVKGEQQDFVDILLKYQRDNMNASPIHTDTIKALIMCKLSFSFLQKLEVVFILLRLYSEVGGCLLFSFASCCLLLQQKVVSFYINQVDEIGEGIKGSNQKGTKLSIAQGTTNLRTGSGPKQFAYDALLYIESTIIGIRPPSSTYSPYVRAIMLFLQPLLFSVFPLFVLTIVVFKLVLATESRKKNVPPSPRKLPIIGNFHQLGSSPHHALRSLSQQHGPLMLLHFGSVPVLVVTSADASREVMKTYDSIFCNRPKATLPDKLLFGSKDMAFSPYGEYWTQIRSIGVVQLLNSKKVESFRNVREEETTLVMEEIRKGSYNSSVLNLSEMLMSLTNDVVCRVALGRKYSGGGDGKRFMELLEDFEELLGVFCIGDYIPWLAWVDRISGLLGRDEKVAHGFNQFIEGVIKDHIHKGDIRGEQEQQDFVDTLLQYQRDNINTSPIHTETIKALIMAS